MLVVDVLPALITNIFLQPFFKGGVMSVLFSRVKSFIKNLRRERRDEDDGWEFCATEGCVYDRR